MIWDFMIKFAIGQDSSKSAPLQCRTVRTPARAVRKKSPGINSRQRVTIKSSKATRRSFSPGSRRCCWIYKMVSGITFKIIFFGLVILAVALEVAGDIFFKKWAIESKGVLLYIGLLIYFIGTIFWAISLRYEYLSKAISVFTVLNLVIVVLVGVLYFKEDLSLINKVGIGLGILSVILIEV